MNEICIWGIGTDAPITTLDSLPPKPDIPRGCLLVLAGRAPIWRYCMALHEVHGSPAAAIATYDPKIGAVVVATHTPRYFVGQWVESVKL